MGTKLTDSNVYLQVKIFYKDLNIQIVTQSEEFPDIWSFMSNLGGAMSLYLGVSIIAAFELLEFVIRLMASAITQYQ